MFCALAIGIIAYFIRFGGEYSPPWPNLVLGFLIPSGWLLCVYGAGAYDVRFIGTGSDEYRRIFNAGVSLTALVAVGSYATKAEVARGYVVAALPLLTLLDLLLRYRLRKRLHRMRAKGECMRRVVAVGHAYALADLIRELARTSYHGMEIVAACLPATAKTTAMAATASGEPTFQNVVSGVPVLGDLGEITDVVEGSGADAVAVLACPELDGLALRRLAWDLEKAGTDLFVAPALMDVAGPRTTIRPIAGFPLLHVDHPELIGPRRIVKSAFDKLAAGLALLLLTPLLCVIAVLIKIADRASVFFVQVRIGRDGQEFRMLKFRTMVEDADLLRAELADRSIGDGVMFKLKDDPRITRIGGWLRRYSIDELPQLINVLRGDMSLVGPRPPLPSEVEQYGKDVCRRLVVKPGLTGLWQVSGRSDLPWEEAVRLDLRYVENWSLALDMQIIWKTFAAVSRSSGAY